MGPLWNRKSVNFPHGEEMRMDFMLRITVTVEKVNPCWGKKRTIARFCWCECRRRKWSQGGHLAQFFCSYLFSKRQPAVFRECRFSALCTRGWSVWKWLFWSWEVPEDSEFARECHCRETFLPHLHTIEDSRFLHFLNWIFTQCLGV